MKIDRSRFLHLVAVIAGSSVACGAKQEPIAAIMVPVEAPPDASTPLATSPSPSEPNASTQPDERRPEPPPERMGRGSIWDRPWDPNAKPISCADLKCPGPTREAMGVLRTTCKTIEKRLAAEPFQRFMTCMMAYNDTADTCDLRKVGEKPDECLHGWWDTPKIDPATQAKCKPIVATCGGPSRSVHARRAITMDECQKVLSVTNAKSEAKMIHCVTEYCGEALTLCHGGYG